jgi:D-alanine-D-alanine ligase
MAGRKHRRRIRVGVLFGGRSVEHQVSIVSAASVIGALDEKKFDVTPIGITPGGRWISGPGALELLRRGGRPARAPRTTLLPDPTVGGLVELSPAGGRRPRVLPLDVVFPVLHGSFGEDGTVQGLLEMAGIPYVGAGVFGSAAGMDKIVTKTLWQAAGIPVLPFLAVTDHEYARDRRGVVSSAEKAFGYPMFVKPSHSGSSIGISKVRNRAGLRSALSLAFRYDRRAIVERGIDRPREIEVAVLGNETPEVSVPGEIIPSNEFYDYDAKYVDGKSTAVVPADLPPAVTRKIRTLAAAAYLAVGCEGMARIDFLLGPRNRGLWLSEVNTIPGFTSISMYPKLWAASGLSYPRLLERLIRLALSRSRKTAGLRTVYNPGRDWFL